MMSHQEVRMMTTNKALTFPKLFEQINY